MDRGTGQTTKQIKEAPLQALYIWPVTNSLSYVKRLAESLNRKDLQIISLDRLTPNLRGINITGIIIDHACILNKNHDYVIEMLKTYAR